MKRSPFNTNLYALPTTQLILGTRLDTRPNFMALAWATRVNFQPPMIGIAVHHNHMSHKAIEATGQFSLCMPSREMIAQTDYLGLVSGKTVDKSELFSLFYGELDNAPMIEECPLNLELQLRESVHLPTNTLFVGEITGAWCNDDCLTDDIPDVEKIKPFLLTMPDNRYWAFGEPVGRAWKEGKTLKRA